MFFRQRNSKMKVMDGKEGVSTYSMNNRLLWITRMILLQINIFVSLLILSSSTKMTIFSSPWAYPILIQSWPIS